MRGTVWIAEEDESVLDRERERRDYYWTATFSAHLDDGQGIADECEHLSLADAIAWGRERSDDVRVRVGADYIDPSGPVPVLERRRQDSETWKDRTAGDPTIPWSVQLGGAPPFEWSRWRELRERRDEFDAIAAAAGADRWDRGRIDELIVDMEAADDAGGFSTYGAPVYDFDFDAISASTEDAAIAAARARLTLPDDWKVGGSAEPVRPTALARGRA